MHWQCHLYHDIDVRDYELEIFEVIVDRGDVSVDPEINYKRNYSKKALSFSHFFKTCAEKRLLEFICNPKIALGRKDVKQTTAQFF